LESELKPFEVKTGSITGTKLEIDAGELFDFVKFVKYEYPEIYNNDKIFQLKPKGINFEFSEDNLLCIFNFYHRTEYCQLRKLAERKYPHLKTEIGVGDNMFEKMKFIFAGPGAERLAALIHSLKKRNFRYKLENPEIDLNRQIEIIGQDYPGIKLYTT